MPGPRGFKPLGGKSRRYSTPRGYRNPKGERVTSISRREYDNIRARQVGFDNRSQLETYRQNLGRGKWSSFLYDIRQKTGRDPTFQDYADIRDVRQRRALLKQMYPDLSGQALDAKDPDLIAADGPLKRILIASGRGSDNGRPVGDS